jgi:SagB-type dehydrogenase family enzyme
MMKNDKIHEIYHENSKLRSQDYDFFSWIQYVNSDSEIRNVISRPNYKFDGYEKIKLEIEKEHLPQSNDKFISLASNRKSTRKFNLKEITFSMLNTILFCANGVTRTERFKDGTIWNLRTTPSGGGLFPIELLFAVKGVENLTDGIYFYNPLENNIVLIDRQSKNTLNDKIVEAMPALESTIIDAAVVFFLVSNLPRIEFKYKARGYRFALIESGHIAQNIVLSASSLDLGSICIGGFLDDEINDFLRIDGVDRAVQYCIAVGYPK